MRDSAGDVFLADCPARLAIEIVTGKWAAVVLFALSRGPCRHGELVDLIGGVSRKVLTQTLRRLQGYGLVERHPPAGAPPRVEYALTELGLTLVGPIAALTDWARTHGAAVADFQEETEREETGREEAEQGEAELGGGVTRPR
ncbi:MULTISPECIES: helix-turn-helix domain-containing protein [Kitasatospora]|uniref:Putative HxlR family transcriptional regulator n=1 Tax=Kitasatospora setae (strain ATCC 33774 / DSM 43861 / JCM 3304 / KCC A-0304 / NBRC 14216 / KM-6054) TaxID=452652 RepID=E4N521_KITSK|nr:MULTISPECIES: helix-turn-helix domain-containing protein [Kitasatospora]BAJ26302.1 putative HxlR family transcriptional regulator [Kitasatospora setae KM-6054]